MTCHEVVELMQRYLDLDLTETEQHTMLAHIHQCPECAALFERLNMVNAELEELPNVYPPFSIVDSILPQLNELGTPIREQSAAAETVRRTGAGRGNRPAWLAFGGFLAAAAIFGLLVLNNQDGFNRIASNTKSVSPADRTSGGDPEADGGDASLKPQPQAGAETGTPSSEKTAAPDAQSAPSDNGRLANPDAGIASVGKNDGAQLRISDGQPTDNVASPLPSLKDKAFAAADKRTFGGDASGGSGSAAGTGQQIGSPKLVAPPAKASSTDNEVTFSPEPAKGALAPPSAADQRPPSAMLMSAPAVHELGSPTGSFSAYVDGQQVKIGNSSDAELFVSPHRWDESDTVNLVSWISDTQVLYQVTASDGGMQEYIIDASKQTERLK